MKILKNIWSQLHLYLLWLLASALIWGLVFSFLTDAPPEKKVTLFIDVESCCARNWRRPCPRASA